MSKSVPVVHFTTVHPRGDTRIWVKQLQTLAQQLGVDVTLCVQDGQGDLAADSEGVSVLDTGSPTDGGRLARMTRGAWRMFLAVRSLRPSVTHFHDPELIPVGMLLKLHGIKVIYDVHEDVPRQILAKHWILPWLRRPVGWVVQSVEWMAARVFDGFVTATPTISQRFPAHKTVTVQNFPILSELVVPDPVPYQERLPHFAYVGSITVTRGVREIVTAMERINSNVVRLQLAGHFQIEGLEKELVSASGWNRVDFHGWSSREQVAQILGTVRAGLVVLHPTENYMDSLPVKMFEYMAAGVPVIASDFPLWRDIVEGAGCGLLVDPLDPDAIARAMQWVLDHPKEAETMGQCGREAIEKNYNWEPEAKKLIGLYRALLGSKIMKAD